MSEARSGAEGEAGSAAGPGAAAGAPTIWFVRHGQTDWNAAGRLQGQHDVPLNATGLAQAAEAAGRLRRIAGAALAEAEFVASPLIRASRTMEVLRAALNLPEAGYRTDPRLREIGFGAWEGSTWSEIRRRDAVGAAARERDRWGYQPAGEGAESYAMLTERVAEAARVLDRPTVIVAHGGTARALLVARGLLGTRAAPRLGIRQGQVLVLEGDRWRWG